MASQKPHATGHGNDPAEGQNQQSNHPAAREASEPPSGNNSKHAADESKRWMVATILALIAAIGSAAAAIFGAAQAWVAYQTMQNSERAFMYAKEILIVGDGGKVGEPPADRPAIVAVTQPNSGDTPARHVVFNINFCARAGGLPNGFSYPPSPVKQPPLLVAPKGDAQATFTLPHATLIDVELGRKQLTVYGDVTYTDIFDVTHRTEYCYVYFGSVLKEDKTIERHLFNSCNEHNCHDGDCPKQWGNPNITCTP